MYVKYCIREGYSSNVSSDSANQENNMLVYICAMRFFFLKHLKWNIMIISPSIRVLLYLCEWCWKMLCLFENSPKIYQYTEIISWCIFPETLMSTVGVPVSQWKIAANFQLMAVKSWELWLHWELARTWYRDLLFKVQQDLKQLWHCDRRQQRSTFLWSRDVF